MAVSVMVEISGSNSSWLGISNTRLLWLKFLRFYEWRVGGRGPGPRRLGIMTKDEESRRGGES